VSTNTDTFTAGDSIRKQLNDAWVALTPAVVGSTQPVRLEWDGVDTKTKRDPQKPFAAVFVKHLDGGQATFADPLGQRKFSRSGLVTVQVFQPLLNSGGLSLVQKLAIIARDAFEGKSTADGVWFQNVKLKDIGDDAKGWYQINVLASFTYDELK